MNRRLAVALLLGAVSAACEGGERAVYDSAPSSLPSRPTSPERAPAPAAEGATANADMSLAAIKQQPPTQTTGTAADSIAPMLIRTGDARVEVDSLEPAVVQVRQLAQRIGGYVANTSMQTGDEQLRQATIELKMPAPRFDQAVSGLASIGEVESVNVATQDVGEEFVDVSARVANSRRLETRLIELLGNRTGRLQDVLSVERELARVREEIERYEGRLRYLRSRVAVSTLTVTVHEPVPILSARPGSSVIGDAFRGAWRNFVLFIAWLIESLGVLIPVAAIAVLARWLFVRYARRRPPRTPGEAKA
jgi:hypothetical protein